jgi:hypothetical protein
VHAVTHAPHALLAVEVDKAELGSGGDPYFQGQAHYFRHWATAAERDDGRAAAFAGDLRPALMIELVGPMLRVSALASAPGGGRVLCEPLTPLLHLFALTGQREHMGRLVATLRATRDALRALRAHYDAVAAAAAPPAALLLPYPLREGGRFARVAPLAPGGKLLYDATWRAPGSEAAPAPARVCVKLTQRYAPHVHALWAAAGLAPALHACEPLDGGGPWLCVVMELLSPPTWRPLPELPPAERAAAAAAALAALAAAHAQRLPGGGGGGGRCVHGDARGVNVLVAPRAAAGSAGGGWHVRFVDFDWAGEEGVEVYPPLMSTAVPWAPGARPGMPLLQAHDAHLLARER